MKRSALRGIPSVDKVVRELNVTDIPRPAVLAVVRRELASIRESLIGGGSTAALPRIRAALEELRRAKIQPVINGTGIIVHTNLGRSPLAPAVVKTLGEVGADYNNLEYDLGGGERGTRAAYVEHNLAVLCGSQAATVVNNCAAALILILRHFTKTGRQQVVISRGELVQIGGGFRIPDILEASGATLREIGTTNKTTAGDYSRAISKQTAMVLKVHRSNFFMSGFTDAPSTAVIAAIAKKAKAPFVEDLGSGAVFDTSGLGGGEREPTPSEVLKQGVDLVCFSGDKLLGGPQAGIIAGKAKYIAALKREPFFRALRCDKLILAALQTTVDLHLGGEAKAVPIVEMMMESSESLRLRAQRLVGALGGLAATVTVGTARAQIGGGSLPRTVIPSVTLDLLPGTISLADLAARLRAASPPVVGYISGGRYKLDLRTIFVRQEGTLISVLRDVLMRGEAQFSPGGPGAESL